jgi:uncharacterized protein YdcH (DUF465 family)
MDRKQTSLIPSQISRPPRQTLEKSPSAVGNDVVLSASVTSSTDPARFISPPKQKTGYKTNEDIVPMDLHHPILREFPEHREVIRRLKGSSDHFRSLFDEYHRLDDEIYRIEEDIDFATDQEIEELKMRRAKLKDYIYHIIRHVPVTLMEAVGVPQEVAG